MEEEAWLRLNGYVRYCSWASQRGALIGVEKWKIARNEFETPGDARGD